MRRFACPLADPKCCPLKVTRDGLAEILAFVFMTRVDADGAAGEPKLADMPGSVNVEFAGGVDEGLGSVGGGRGLFLFYKLFYCLELSFCFRMFRVL